MAGEAVALDAFAGSREGARPGGSKRVGHASNPCPNLVLDLDLDLVLVLVFDSAPRG